MSDTDPCGSGENKQFLPGCGDVNQFMQKALKGVLQATKCSNEMPSAGDDFDYYSSFQGFQDVMNMEGKRLLHMIQGLLKHENVKINLGSAGGATDIEDKLDMLMDANDQILEKVGSWLDEAAGIKKDDSSLVVATATPKGQTSASWNKKSPGSSTSTPSFRLLSARNIQRPQLKFKDKIDNGKRPFIPIIKCKPNALQSLEESLKLPADVTPEQSEQPDFIHPHPYQHEIDHLSYGENQLKPVTLNQPPPLSETTCVFINTTHQLSHLVEYLKKQTEIAIDLEHHSYRSFQGITCLMQLSSRTQDYLVDTIELRSDLQCLNEVFTDSSIVKVLHGSDADIEWLQRDLGLYIVNMFDTGQAARVMSLSRFSLAYLLQQYCDVTADKQYQLADWRIRPLPAELEKYAREDTHYLLYIYDKMKNELLDQGNESKNLLMSVLHRSAQICKKVYKKPGSSVDAYKDLYMKNKKVFNSQQLFALKELFNWRDETARMEDESYGYVLPNHMLLQICDILPREKQGILACCNPIPPLVRQYLNEIHSIIKKARETLLHQVDTTKSVRRPTHQQHPRYNVDSLLNCPHDLSHLPQLMNDSVKTLIDSSLVTNKSSVLSDPQTDERITMKSEPVLSVLDWKYASQSTQSVIKKKVAEIASCFVSPYMQYLPCDSTKAIITPAKLSVDIQTTPSWKLLPSSVKRTTSEDSVNSPSLSVPPSKRSRTDLNESAAVNKHIRFDGDTEVTEKHEDDKIAIPQDIEIPLRFQVPSKKKKKKKKLEDIDIIDSVQKHLAHIRKLQESADKALGENSGDEQPLDLSEKIQARIEQRKLDKQNKKLKKGNKGAISKSDKHNDGKPHVNKTDTIDSQVSTSEPITIDVTPVDVTDEEMKEEAGQFKPYDYSEGTKKLLQGPSSTKAYFDPKKQMKGGRKGRNSKVHMKKGQKSYSWKQK